MALRDGQKFIKDAASAALLHSGTLAASGAGTGIFDTGGATTKGEIYLNVTAVEVDTGDEIYTIYVEGCNASPFAGDMMRLGGGLELGDAVPLIGTTDKGVGNYVIPFTNDINGTVWRYLRLYVVIAGTIATGITFTATMGVSD